MMFDDATLMAYADGELGAIDRKRVEQAMAADPALAERVTAMTAFGARVRAAFDPVARAPVPAALSTMLAGNVVPLAPGRTRPWLSGLALAASLVLGVGLGTRLAPTQDDPRQGMIALRGGTMVATGTLARALDTQLASTPGDIRMLVSFRSATGYCRVFASGPADGIACRSGDTWQLRQTRSGNAAPAAAYRQAASTDAALLSAAQDMMNGAPLDATAERQARGTGWR